jgi:hypothetical protein
MKKISLRVVIGFLLFFGGVGTLLTLHYGGDLMRDVAIGGAALEAHPAARVLRADCTRYYHLMSACKIEYENRAAGQSRATIQQLQSTSFLLFGSMAGEKVRLLHPRSRPDIITTSANMAYLGNRVLALSLLLGICLIASIGLVLRYLRENRASDGAEAEAIADSARAMDEAMTRHLQARGLVRTPTVTGGPSGAGTFGRRGG